MTAGSPRLSLLFSARELRHVVALAVIFTVVGFAIESFGHIVAPVWPPMVPVAIAVNGITFMLFLTRVEHIGMVTLFAVLVALLGLLGGDPLPTAGMVVLLGIAVEPILYAGRFRSRPSAILSYAVFSLSSVTPFLTVLEPPLIGALASVVLLAALVGGLLGTAVTHRRVLRSGLA